MNQYLDAAIKAARAAGALVRENFGRPLKVNVEEAYDIKLELDVRSQALITDYQGTRAPTISSRQSSTISAPRSPKSFISRRMAIRILNRRQFRRSRLSLQRGVGFLASDLDPVSAFIERFSLCQITRTKLCQITRKVTIVFLSSDARPGRPIGCK